MRGFFVLFALAVAAMVGLGLMARGSWAQSNTPEYPVAASRIPRVTVLSPTVDLSQDYTERTSLRVTFGVDAISAASDSCARCHQQGVRSRRQDASFSLTRKLDALKWTFGGAYSQENFYLATTGLTSLSRDLATGNTTVAGGFSFSLNQPLLHPQPTRENQYASDAFVSVTQTLTKTTIAQAGYELARINGYQDNPFLRTSVNGIMVVGHVPDLRTRQTVTARLRQACRRTPFSKPTIDTTRAAAGVQPLGIGLTTASPAMADEPRVSAGGKRASLYQRQKIDPIPKCYGRLPAGAVQFQYLHGKAARHAEGSLWGLPVGRV